jgi:hypothetical protein
MAVLCLAKKGKLKIDAVIFADPKAELPETYDYIEKYAKPLCEKLNIPFYVISNGSLYDDNFKRKIIPYRLFRSCSDKFKVRPIHKFVKEFYPDSKTILGIDFGEQRRVRSPDFLYPLIEMGIDREGCRNIIAESGYPIPVKSGCFFCPFTRFDNWKWLLKTHPDLFNKAILLEENGQGWPEYTITDKPLRKIKQAIEQQKSMCLWIDENESCGFCHS